MARKVFGYIKVEIRLTEVDDAAGAGVAAKKLEHNLDYKKEFTPGTTDGINLDRIYSSAADQTTSPQDLDVLGGLNSVLDSGQSVNLVDLVAVCVTNESAAGDVQVGAGANPVAGVWLAAGDGSPVKPGGILLWVAPSGIAPVAATGDILRTVASAGTVASKRILAGRSA